MVNNEKGSNIYGIMSRLRTSGQFELDIGVTKDPCGLLELSKALNRNLSRFAKSIQTGILSLEKGISFHLTEKEIDKNQVGFNEIGELASFIYRIFYMDPKKLDEETLNRYTTDKKVQLYLPDVPTKHGTEIYPPEDYNFEIPATVSLRIYDKKTKRTLVFGTMPIFYSYYENNKDLAGAGLDDARQAIQARTRHYVGGLEKVILVLEKAKETAEKPHMFIQLIDDETNSTLQSIRGDLVNHHGKIGLDLSTPYDQSLKVFVPLNLTNLGEDPKHISKSQKQLFALTRILLSTNIKSSKTIKEAYQDISNQK